MSDHRIVKGRKGAGGLLTAGAVLAGVTLAAAGAGAETLQPGCTQSGTTVTCSYTTSGVGGTFTVPTGVTSLDVTLVGGSGAAADPTPGGTPGGAGGKGGVVSGTLSVAAGTTFTVQVGGNGTVSAGGANGGGNGGPDGGCAGGGGGASDLAVAGLSGLTYYVLAAGGGGGGCGLDATLASVAFPGGAGTDAAAGTPSGPTAPAQINGGNAVARDAFSPNDGGGGGAGIPGGQAGAGAACFASCGSGAKGGAGGTDLLPNSAFTATPDSSAVPRVTITYTAPSVGTTATITFGPATPPNGVVAAPYSFQYSASASDASAVSYSPGAGLPPGLALSGSGLLSGTPTAAGTYNFAVTASSPTASATRTDTVTILAQQTTPAATVSPSSLSFGNQTQGTTSPGQAVTIKSTGTAPLQMNAISFTGGNASDFAESSNCPASLDPGMTCTVTVTFTPSTTTAEGATMVIDDSAGNQAVVLSGTGTAPLVPAATVTPSSLDFGAQSIGSTSTPKTVTIQSSGTAPLAINSITINGSNSGDFAQTNNCPASLAAGSSCTAAVTFSPSITGPESATLAVNDNAGGHTVTLSGSGQPVADLGVSMAGNPNAVLSGALLTYTITVVNHGPQAAGGVTMSLALSSSVQYSKLTAPSGWSCTAPAVGHSGSVICTSDSLASGASATFTVTVKVVASGKTMITSTATVSATASTDTQPANNSAAVTTSVKGGQK